MSGRVEIRFFHESRRKSPYERKHVHSIHLHYSYTVGKRKIVWTPRTWVVRFRDPAGRGRRVFRERNAASRDRLGRLCTGRGPLGQGIVPLLSEDGVAILPRRSVRQSRNCNPFPRRDRRRHEARLTACPAGIVRPVRTAAIHVLPGRARLKRSLPQLPLDGRLQSALALLLPVGATHDHVEGARGSRRADIRLECALLQLVSEHPVLLLLQLLLPQLAPARASFGDRQGALAAAAALPLAAIRLAASPLVPPRRRARETGRATCASGGYRLEGVRRIQRGRVPRGREGRESLQRSACGRS